MLWGSLHRCGRYGRDTWWLHEQSELLRTALSFRTATELLVSGEMSSRRVWAMGADRRCSSLSGTQVNGSRTAMEFNTSSQTNSPRDRCTEIGARGRRLESSDQIIPARVLLGIICLSGAGVQCGGSAALVSSMKHRILPAESDFQHS